ncbi:MAG: BC1881 family protein [Tepidibacter sp.]|uniref:BC1881 family protein n=1 Tax=Tepidibacter sp. TaxID=2529387 RepID=UPI0025EC3B85|nr:BC1881 family protein [Tepidibacter sp.]MCT4507557.1 BC1881 family protein [Tepidibacter sp.]
MFGLTKKIEDIKTEDLIKELARRKGITLLKSTENQQYKITCNHSRIKEFGKAKILLIRNA